jgi:hypothetical protein
LDTIVTTIVADLSDRTVAVIDRKGPLVKDEAGLPVQRRYYQDLYGEVADAAGISRAVWNMFARNAGGTDAREADEPSRCETGVSDRISDRRR